MKEGGGAGRGIAAQQEGKKRGNQEKDLQKGRNCEYACIGKKKHE